MKIELTINLGTQQLARTIATALCVLSAFTLSADTGDYIAFAAGDDLTAAKLDENFQAIISDVNKSVKSNASTQERVERVRIANSGSCAISSQSGTWVSSVTGPTGNACVLSFAGGTFSGAPSCTVSCNGSRYSYIEGEPTTSGISIGCLSEAGGNANQDMTVICMGPK